MTTRGRSAYSPGRFLARLRAIARPVTIFTIVYFAMLVYPPLRLAGLLWPDWQPGTGALLAVIVLPIAGRIAYELRPGTASRGLAAVSLSWLGLAFLLFCVLLPAELLMLLLDPAPRTAGLLLAGLWFALGIGSLVNAQRIGVRRLSLPAPQLTRPLRLVQISDVHVGSRMGGFLARVSKRVAALEPDLVMITGDLVDFRDIPVRDLASLSTLGAPTFFCIGNHERYVDCEAICARLESLGVKVLREAVDTSLPPLVIVGLDDAEPPS